MIKILIIEDNPEKLKCVNKFLNSVCSISGENIDKAGNIKEGRECLIREHYDLLLLDLVLPNDEESEKSPEFGSNFLDEIHYNPNINTPIHIIGITEFDEIYKQYLDSFDDKLWGLINFNLKEIDWQTKLKNKIFYLQSYKKNYAEFIKNSNKYDVAIITALNIEFEQLLKTSHWKKLNSNEPIVFYETVINTKDSNNIKIIAGNINQMGMQAAASVASKVLSLFNPSLLFIVGICAGIEENVKLGDIIIANQIWDYESGKKTEDSNGQFIFKPDNKLLPTDIGVLAKLTEFANKTKYRIEIYDEYQGSKPDAYFNVHFGSVGSGPYVLSSKNYMEELLKKDRKLIGIDMEGYGVYKAAQFHNGTKPIFIKSVTDFGDIKKGDNFQQYASYISAKFVIEYINNIM